ncbi:hypothetical protein [Paenibacillus monticola]|uniref:Uncharacterized protein n=1 Tax=Paenibacillus monticola TaxID=2666075 RepID=A0A7X2H9J7_9BACL|nr:hypothetical protein [Paenibacillus monticola]MRN56052.1 hypothetical protein [Paenibacillus monticola]
MKKIGLRSGKTTRRRTLLLSRRAKVRRGLVRKGVVRKTRRRLIHKVVRYGKSKKTLLPRKKRRIRRRVIRSVQVIQPPIQIIPVVEAQQAPQVIPLPPDLGVPPETPPGDAYQQGYTEAYNVGFDAGFAKGFEDGNKLELK